MEVILEMSFLSSNANINFGERLSEKINWRSYIAIEVFFTISGIQLIDKKEFAKEVLNENFETFVVYMIALEAKPMIHPSWAAQIATL